MERIVASFPITEESCRKLLRSKWSPKTLDDLLRHDQRVIENWKRLSDMAQTEPRILYLFKQFKLIYNS